MSLFIKSLKIMQGDVLLRQMVKCECCDKLYDKREMTDECEKMWLNLLGISQEISDKYKNIWCWKCMLINTPPAQFSF